MVQFAKLWGQNRKIRTFWNFCLTQGVFSPDLEKISTFFPRNEIFFSWSQISSQCISGSWSHTKTTTGPEIYSYTLTHSHTHTHTQIHTYRQKHKLTHTHSHGHAQKIKFMGPGCHPNSRWLWTWAGKRTVLTLGRTTKRTVQTLRGSMKSRRNSSPRGVS